jgi:hypothetical protein
MAVAVHQAQIVEGVVFVVSFVVMHFYHVLCCEVPSTEGATATLSLEQSRDPSWFAEVTSQPG